MIDMTKPVPCMKFKDDSFIRQMAHVSQEVTEAWEELAALIEAQPIGGIVEYEAKKMLAEELTDVITSATTMLELIGYDEERRADMQVYVNKKNKFRGYWEE